MTKKNIVKALWPISGIRFLGAHFIRVLIGLLGLMVLLTILELFALATVPAFFAAVWTPDDYFKQVILRFSILTKYVSIENVAVFSAGVLFLSFTIKNFVSWLFVFFENIFFRNQIIELSARLYSLFINSSYSFHLKSNSSELIRIVDVESVRTVLFLRNYLNMIKEVLVIAAVSIFLIISDPTMALISILFLVLIFFIYLKRMKARLNENGIQSQKVRIRELKLLTQGFSSIKISKIHSCERFLTDDYHKAVSEREGYEAFRRLVSVLPKIIVEQGAAIVIVSLVSIYFLTGRPADKMLPSLALFAVAAVRLVPSLNMISYASAEMKYQKPSFETVSKIFASEDEIPLKDELDQANIFDSLQDDGILSIENLSFKYDDQQNEALKSVNFKIQSKEVIGIVGKSGTGKTTLIDLILGLHIPQKGKVFYSGIDIQRDLNGWRKKLGYVPQDIYLLDGTIEENITFGETPGSLNLEAYKKAVDLARLNEVIKELEEGDQTLVGERGVRLSGGQRQRIGIARALYREPDILVLDEATNSLDGETETAVVSALDQISGTLMLIIISHNPAVLKNCDHILEIKSNTVYHRKPEHFLKRKNLRE